MTGSATWAARAERGSVLGLRFVRFAYRSFGRRACQLLLYPIVAYFYLTSRAARQASREYLAAVAAVPEGRRALGGAPSERLVFAHLLEFAHQLLDRFSIWSGARETIRIAEIGREKLRAAVDEGRGGILAGAHLGSFDMMRELSRRTGPTVNVLMFTRHATRINAFFEELDPESRVRVIELDPGSVGAALAIKRCIERGELVGIAADRLWHAPRERTATVEFLGRPARLPLGPFLLQTVLGCPLLVALCIRVGPGRYETHVEPLSCPGPVPRGERTKRATELAQAYARVLESHCLAAPLQWFNFFPFFADSGTAA